MSRIQFGRDLEKKKKIAKHTKGGSDRKEVSCLIKGRSAGEQEKG